MKSEPAKSGALVSLRTPAVKGFLVAAISVPAALLIYWMFPRLMATSATPPFIAAVMLSAWVGGLWPGLFAAVLSAGIIERLNLPPNTVKTAGLAFSDLPRDSIFMLCAIAIAWLTERQQHAHELLIAESAERRRTEEELQEARANFARITRITTMGEMAASIAHEINQPLAGVVTNGNACMRWLSADTPNLDEARKAVTRIVSDGHRAAEVISRIRALMEKAPLKMEPLNINELILDTVALANREISQSHAAARTQLAGQLPPVMGDRIQLQQAMLNLIVNGLEAMAAVNDHPRELRIETRRANNGDGVLIEVRDSGAGIDPKTRERLFEAFFTTKSGGMGLGLSISNSIVAAHGGRLLAVPNSGHGTAFQITLPIASEVRR